MTGNRIQGGMRAMRRASGWSRPWLMALAVLALSACGGGSGGSGEPPQTEFHAQVLAAGTASETEAAELLLLRVPAGLSLDEGLASAQILEIASRRDAEGAYRLTLPADREGLVLSARAIRDRQFDVPPALELLAVVPTEPARLENAVVVSPVTTLIVSAASARSAAALAAAEREVLTALGADDVAAAPANVSLLFAMSAVSFAGDAPRSLLPAIADLDGYLAGRDADAVPEALRTEYRLRLKVAREVLAVAHEPDVATRAAVTELSARLQGLLDAAGSAHDAAVVDALAAAAVQANGGRSLGGGHVAGNLLRYLVNRYALTALDSPVPATALQAIRTDAAVAEIASALDAIRVSVPLLDGELLGDDQARRRAYYYQSELSPLTRVPAMFADIADANVTDSIQVSLAEANAREGRWDLADFIARTQIFGTTAQAQAFRAIGDVAVTAGEGTSIAQPAYRAALELYEARVESLGVANLAPDDITFLAQLVGDVRRGFVAVGDAEGQARAAAPLDAYVDMHGAGLYVANAIGRATNVFQTQARTATELAVAAPDDLSLRAAAEAAVDRFAQITRDIEAYQNPTSLCPAFRTGGDDYHYTVRALYLRNIIEFYRQLGLGEKAVAIVDQDLQGLRPTPYASCAAENQIREIVGSLVRMGEVERADTLIESFVDTNYKADAQARKALALADVARDADDIEAAIEIILAEVPAGTNRPREIMQSLTSASVNDLRLAGTLIARGANDQALIAIDAALDYWQGDEFRSWALAQTTPWTALLGTGSSPAAAGGLKLVELYAAIGAEARVDAVLAEMADLTDAHLQVTGTAHAQALILLARAHSVAGQGARAQAHLDKVAEVTAGLEPSPRASLLNAALRWRIAVEGLKGEEADADAAGTFFVDAARIRSLADAVCCEGIADADLAAARVARTEILNTLSANYLYARYAARYFTWHDGVQLSAAVERLRQEAGGVLDAALDTALSIANASASLNQARIALQYLALMGYEAEAEAGARRIVSAPDRHVTLSDFVGRALLRVNPYGQYTDFPLLTDGVLPSDALAVAAVDTDGDGRPDFFRASASTEAIAASGLTLDDDMDGDGVPDHLDRYPLDATRQ